MKTLRHTLPLFISLLLTSSVAAQTGVSDDRVNLPEGPGSLEGVGENVGINTNMGSMTHSVAIDLPAGFGSVTPSLSLSYSSGAGSGILGMGWSMPMPSIERMTYRGLPDFDSQDDFCADGSTQLVQLPGTNPPIYRARFEGGFVRYTWMDEGDGRDGYWIAEYPDGSKAFFGATQDGTLVPAAQVRGDEGTFRYHMVEKVDVHGHKVVWTYEKFGLYSLPTHVGYVFKLGRPTYEATFSYEERRDEDGLDLLSDAMPGFNLVLRHRLSNLAIKSRGVTIRQYDFTYVPFGESAGITLLEKVEKKGVEGSIYPVINTFEYSKNLGGVGNEPKMMDLGTVEASFGTRTSQLIDINGDALPDIVDATQDGPHKFFLNIPDTNGGARFEPVGIESTQGTKASHNLAQPTVQVLDVNGDGFADLINAATGQVLINKGGGDWDDEASGEGMSNIAEALAEDFDADEGELQSLRFIDFNNDKRIDLMRSTAFETAFFINSGEEGFELVEGSVTIGAGFSDNNLQLADMNGDGLIDVVQLQVGLLRYRLNFGRGMWSDWVNIAGLDLTQAQLEQAELEDINGDALADVVVVQATSVSYALNDNFEGFDELVSLTSEDVTEGIIPLRDSTTTVLFADMNGNGSSDIVWIQTGGKVDALELFPLRPNLMTRLTNGIGSVTEISYETAAQQMARDGGWENWTYKIPFPMNVVAQIDSYDLLTDLHEITEYSYHEGFYDGEEKQFRGFERVETRLLGDETIEEGLTRERFDVGATDAYRNGLLLFSSASSNGRELSERATTYDDCPVAELTDGTELPIRHICPVATTTTLKEGRPEPEWVVTETATEYDGYGNAVRSSNFGITSVGGACEPCGDRGADDFGAPCGSQCLGDERFSTTEFIPTDRTQGRWITSAPFRTRTFGREGSELVTETLIYYDGPDFEGLPLGNLTHGNATRVTVKKEVDSAEVIQTVRNKLDAHGNVIETLDPLGSPDGLTHRRKYQYDAENLRAIRADILLEDPEGNPYTLRRDVTYEPFFDKTTETTAWMRVVDGNVVSTQRSWTMTYDEFGRMSARFLPGNTTDNPDQLYTYDLQSPTSRIIVQKASVAGGALDVEAISCFDGRGRLFQRRNRLEQGRYQVSGLTRFNIRSQPVEVFQPYTDTGVGADQCDTNAPPGSLSSKVRYDARYRALESSFADDGIHGTRSVSRSTYAPLVTIIADAEDTDPSSPHAGTPTTTRRNGLGAVVAIERLLSADDRPAVYGLHYDSLGRIVGATDPDGNLKEQAHDLLGRLLRRSSPNTSDETTFEYDDASNLIRTTDPRGVTERVVYDGLNRAVAQFDAADPEGTRITWRYDHDPDCDSLWCTNTEGMIASVTYPGLDGQISIDQRGYDLRGRSVVTRRHLFGHAFEFETTFDNLDRPIEVTYPSGQTLARTFDDASRLTSIEGIVNTVAYDERGQMTQIGCSDGSGSVFAYDDIMRLSEALTTNDGGDIIQGFGYTRDRLGHLLAIDDLADGTGGRPSFETRFGYDAWYRTTQTHFAPGQGNEEVLDIEFDKLDNITARTSSLGESSKAPTGRYSYDSFAPNGVTDFAGMAFDYDAAGHTTLRGNQTYAWDYKGRMTAVQEDAQTVSRFVYGSDQGRVAKLEGDQTTLYPSATFEVRDGISSLYVKMGRLRVARIESDAMATRLLADLTPDDQINAADGAAAFEQGLGSGPHLWSSVRRLLMETGPDDGTTYLHHDHLGSFTTATGLVNGQQEVLGQRAFYPTGTERPGGFGYVDEYGFTGQELDRSTGLIHFDWRYLDPITGRWLSIDPLYATTTASGFASLGQSTTAYAYVAGNFANAFDPTGLDSSSDVSKSNDQGNAKKLAKKNKKKKKKNKKDKEEKEKPSDPNDPNDADNWDDSGMFTGDPEDSKARNVPAWRSRQIFTGNADRKTKEQSLGAKLMRGRDLYLKGYRSGRFNNNNAQSNNNNADAQINSTVSVDTVKTSDIPSYEQHYQPAPLQTNVIKTSDAQFKAFFKNTGADTAELENDVLNEMVKDSSSN